MTLYKRGNVLWAYRWVDGVRYAKSTGTGNRKLAEQIDYQFKEELNLRGHQLPQLNPDMTFGELFAQFIANAGPKEWHIDRAKVLIPYFADTPIGRIGRNVAREYRLARHRQKEVSDTTVNRDLECLRHMLFWAVDEGLLASNPLARVPLVRERRKRRPVMSVEEEMLILAVASPHLNQIIQMALYTGMRRGEILKQVWEDIDFPRRLLSVSHSKTPEGEAREIPLTDRILDMFSEIRRNEGPVFTFKGKPIQDIKTAWRATIRRAGIRYCRFHDLRHTFATRLMEAGVQQEIRKALMGHSSGEDVHSTYVHVELPAKREAIHKLEEWVKTQTEITLQREVQRLAESEAAIKHD